MKVKIVNHTGFPQDTRVLREDGTKLDLPIRSISTNIAVNEPVTADVELVTPLIEIDADLRLSVEDLEFLANRIGMRLVNKGEKE